MTDPARTGEITALLRSWGAGDRGAFDRLFGLVYEELHALARAQVRRGPQGTLSPTGLVHEVYLRLVERSGMQLEDRRHFFALSARAMRQIVVDFARRRAADKRGGSAKPLTLDERVLALPERAAEIVALDDALGRLETLEPRLSRVVELRFFGGLSIEETAESLGVSPRTVKREWQKARAFLFAELYPEGGA
jgi:RNA polymerase sigma factor (TIGR02999 family)